MSHAVDPADLASASARYGNTPFLLYALADGSARINHVVAQVADVEPIVTIHGFGRGVVRRVEGGAPLSLLWPARNPDDFSLIADGIGSIDAATDSDEPTLRVHVTKAVLHRPAPVDGKATC